ncbi:hypothetical protein OG458_41615 (plasmid) [Streptomyces sp. NBC_01281]|uniref:hypothetical protein n=1 Tax=Streptomyces sp. NBC_01281 TaxID=2903811 RepID=UPI002E147926|nr:hypothetical protein OG458_41615 [Streptomyces sp. NBC_01281]
MFDNHDTLHQALSAAGIWNGLYTAFMATSSPPLAIRAQCSDDGSCGLEFFEQRSHIHNAPVSGSVSIDLTNGEFIVRADGYAGHRWHSALDRLEASSQTNWSWKPDAGFKPGRIDGELRPYADVAAETTIDRSSRHDDNVLAGLGLLPDTRTACDRAWVLAVDVVGALVTGETSYRSPVVPEPAPFIDYRAAANTVAGALELIDECTDFGAARDSDPRWPTVKEAAAVRALRDFRDGLADLDPPHGDEAMGTDVVRSPATNLPNTPIGAPISPGQG